MKTGERADVPMRPEDWYVMPQASEARWQGLMAEARARRELYWGHQVTYSRKVFVPLTNLCRDRCAYCVFAKQPGEEGAGYLRQADVMDIVRRGEQAGCKEVLFSLGERPEQRYPAARQILSGLGYETTHEYTVAMCDLVLRESALIPHVNGGTLTVGELLRLKPVCGSVGLMLESVSRRLTRPGMPHHACPDKVPLQRLRTLERAGRLKVATTSGILIGIGETWQERIDSLLLLADLHRRHGHLQEVIVQNFRAKPGTPMVAHAEPDIEDMLRTLTAARLILPGRVSLQAPPNLNEAFERYLEAGINDWGGVSPVTADHINPERAWPAIDRLAARTARQGLSLVERLTVYPAFQASARGFLDARIQQKLQHHAGADGWAKHQVHRQARARQGCVMEG